MCESSFLHQRRYFNGNDYLICVVISYEKNDDNNNNNNMKSHHIEHDKEG